jgi:hypothetical protein
MSIPFPAKLRPRRQGNSPEALNFFEKVESRLS